MAQKSEFSSEKSSRVIFGLDFLYLCNEIDGFKCDLIVIFQYFLLMSDYHCITNKISNHAAFI